MIIKEQSDLGQSCLHLGKIQTNCNGLYNKQNHIKFNVHHVKMELQHYR